MKEILNYNRKALPNDIAELAWKRYDRKYSLSFETSSRLSGMFSWDKTEEKFHFWEMIDEGDYRGFYRKYPKKVDNYSII